MGIDRSINSNQPPTEIQKGIVNSFNVSYVDMYDAWSAYVARKLSGSTAYEALWLLKLDPNNYNMKAIDCFTALGFELFSLKLIEEVDEKQGEFNFGQ